VILPGVLLGTVPHQWRANLVQYELIFDAESDPRQYRAEIHMGQSL